MRLKALLDVLAQNSAVSQVIDLASSRVRTDYTAAVVPGVRPALLAAMALGKAGLDAVRPEVNHPLLVVCATTREAEEMVAALRCYLPDEAVEMLPAWETLPHERLSPRADTVAARLAVLRRLAHSEEGAIGVLVVPVRALLAPVIAGLGEIEPLTLATGAQLPLEAATEHLVKMAYTRVDMVENRGEFAVRGGILDVFPPTCPRPVRVDYFGDEIDEISSFAVSDQRSIEVLKAPVVVTACRELLLSDVVRERAAALVTKIPGAADLLEKLAEGIYVEGMESLAPVLVDKMVPLLELTGQRLTVISEPERVRRRAEDLAATTQEFLAAAWTSAASGGQVPVDLSAAAFAHLADVRQLSLAKGLGWWSFNAFASTPDMPSLPITEVPGYGGGFEAAVRQVGQQAKDGWRVVISADGPGPARRLAEVLGEGDIPARIVADLDEVADLGASDGSGDGVVRILPASAYQSFLIPSQKFAFIGQSQITGRASASPRAPKAVPARRSKRSVDPLSLHPGDLVVHSHHGVGRFVELTRRPVPGNRNSSREYLVIEYAPSKRGQPADRLMVPTDSLDAVSKYVGGDAPALSKMGGADWQKTKAKARKAVREIAGELVRLYAARQAAKGHAFSPDTPWQAELEQSFAYTETPDQLVTIDEVKADMEKSAPMDRLICGDVGYGKTEIAVRAAFKAVQDGKQVAVLVPTTLLVSQHAETFTERFAGFPVTVAQLSRFQSAKESQQVLRDLEAGRIDVVVGTHRLLTGSVKFKDLGLVIIDEEQRFGVEHKEALKAMRTDVDVLSMSATPIPRTLEMAISGIREMSILQTPPEERQPVLTFVGAYTDAQVSAAIRRELLRDGQVFYVHNRVDSISSVAAHITELVPEARVRTAHGKMNEHQLEAVIQDFWNHEFDVLVCTTIVETGLDISNANTLIVDRADTFGLSQLHQLRGRVGRGRERAYAYFFYPGDKALTETAHERLKTIAANTELGAGLAVAQRDLEIRGAGNLLGGAQSGHVEGVGFDLYVRMVSDAVAAYRGDAPTEKADVRMDLQVDAHIPEGYVRGERLRLEVYAKIAATTTPEQEADVREELVDRYGPIPPQVDLLFAVARLREIVRKAGIAEIVTQGKYLRVSPVELRDSQVMRLKRLHPGTVIKAAVRQVLVPLPLTSRVGGSPLTDGPLLEWVETLVTKILVPFGE